MSILATVELFTHQMWPQGDARDPLGVWGARVGVTGDASGGEIKVEIAVPELQRGAHIFACYSANIAKLTGTSTVDGAQIRLLTNWPDMDPLPGLQGYSSAKNMSFSTDTDFTAPFGAIANQNAIENAERFILLFTQPASSLNILELKHGGNEDLATYAFEAYGYYWDREVMYAPGGPRHPGSS